jgi:hypothetical protein
MNFQLSQEEFDLLLLALGIAIGTCYKDGNRALAHDILRLANAVNKDNPHWKPYTFEPAKQEDR